MRGSPERGVRVRLMFLEEKKRVPISASVKKEVYARAGGKCERCGTKMTMKQGHFHHTRSPYVRAHAKTIQFLCPNCHSWRGHERTTRTVRDFLFGEEKIVKVKRKKVSKIKPLKKGTSVKNKSKNKNKRKSTNKRKTKSKRGNPTPMVGNKQRSRTKSGRWRKKRSDAGKPKNRR